MAKKRSLIHADDHMSALGQFAPLDPNPDWAPVYAALTRRIGPGIAFAWFGPYRLLSHDAEILRCASWGRFQAKQSLAWYGDVLAQAANVQRIEVAYSGGFPPFGKIDPEQAGTAQWPDWNVSQVGKGGHGMHRVKSGDF